MLNHEHKVVGQICIWSTIMHINNHYMAPSAVDDNWYAYSEF